MNKAAARAALPNAELTNGLKKRQRFNITNRATHFDNRDIDLLACSCPCTAKYEVLNLVCDVRNDLNGLTKVLAPSLLAKNPVVNLAGGEVIKLAHTGIKKALVVPEVKVGLGAIFSDKHLTVLKGAHGAWVYVEIGVHFNNGDL
jgi:hypothetical protein